MPGATSRGRAGARHALALGLLAVATLCAQNVASPPQVATQSGNLSGVTFDGVVSYKGIPYAAPPVGALRWAPPQPAVPWEGIRPADDYGASCPQAVAIDLTIRASRAVKTSEDCLTLNVWAPVTRAKPLPVMVFIHGGGNDTGSGSSWVFDGKAFARDGIVLVTLNYRLGVLGFFAPDPSAGDADFGLLDQIAALRWVRANIAAFGGDPSNVTLFGESAGAFDTVAIAAAPAASGLITRAISESAGSLWEPASTYAQAHAQTRNELAQLGLPKDASIATLRALPVERLIRPGVGAVDPAVDGDVIVSPDADARMRAVHVPLIIGTNAGEGSLLDDGVTPSSVVKELPAADYVRLTADDRAAHDDDDTISRDLFRDAYFAAPALWLDRLIHDDGGTVYCYRFDYILSLLRARRFAANHGSELPYVFDSLPNHAPLSDTDDSLIAMLHQSWVNFAKTGVPSAPGLPPWTPCDPASGRMMVFDASPSVRPIDAARLNAFIHDLAPKAP